MSGKRRGGRGGGKEEEMQRKRMVFIKGRKEGKRRCNAIGWRKKQREMRERVIV